MDTATAGLIGTAIGASGALTAVFLTHYFTQRRENDRYLREQAQEKSKWLRDQKQTCYHNAVKHLIRVCALGAHVKSNTFIKLPDDAPTTWYDDIAEANAWLTSLHYFCGDYYYDDIGSAATEFLNLSNWLIGFKPTGTRSRTHFLHILSEDGELDYQAFVDFMNQLECTITNCARREFQLGPRHSSLD
ncbi:hypothetical protein ACO2Q2_16170 [Dyella sp. KRB-257]|uniref:hypothetical protein n=1 Tax=Dyella sp. KRB-257 TaxID=3400915 RepID=UPI003C084414